MKWTIGLLAAALVWVGAGKGAWGEGAHRIGVGAHYWVTLDDIDVDDVDEDGFSWAATYQYKPGLLGLGLDVEWKKEGFGGAPDDIIEPQAYVILGQALYAAAGVGGYYTDGEFADDPFYLFRAGFDVEVLPGLHLDIHAIYRFEEWDAVEDSTTDPDSDTVTLGAAARISF